jgi:hypothetical protein
MSIWILTEEYNDYDQHGECFLEVFEDKPDRTTLAWALTMNGHGENFTNQFIDHVLKGGGRVSAEHCWLHLREVTPFKAP